MGYDLVGNNDSYFRWNNVQWLRVSGLAATYGWEPEGTTLPPYFARNMGLADPEEWDGGYGSNDFQIVSDEDARNMGRALHKALGDIPDSDKSDGRNANRERFDLDSPRDHLILITPIEEHNDDCGNLEYFSGPKKGYLTRFVEFCYAGGFTIT